jgi:hypothetical protein
LPFADFGLDDLQIPAAETTDSVQLKQQLPLHLSNLPIRIRANLYHADRRAMLPEMGAAGAALLAWTLLKNLSGTTFPEKA